MGFISTKEYGVHILRFILVAIITFVICYPPMWKAPISTLEYIIESSSSSSTEVAAQGNFPASYFNGFSVYAAQALNKINGVSFLWVITLAVSFLYVVLQFKTIHFKHKLLYILIFFGTYLLFLNISDKRFFRYLTPVLMGITIFLGSVVSDMVYKWTYTKRLLEKLPISR